MIIEKELKKIFHQLVKEEVAQIAIDGTDITIRVLDDASKFSLGHPSILEATSSPRVCATASPIKRPSPTRASKLSSPSTNPISRSTSPYRQFGTSEKPWIWRFVRGVQLDRG